MSENINALSSEELVHQVIDNGNVSAQQFLVVSLCLFLNMLDGFDITAMAVVASAVSDELQLSPDRLGWVFSFALAGMMTGAMLLAPLSDIVGRRKVIIASVALVGVSVCLTAMAGSLSEFIVLRFIAGIGAGAMLACQATLAAEYSPEKYRALSVAAVTAGYPLGAMMTSTVAEFVMPEFGWRGMFWFGGALTTAMVVVVYFFIPESLKFLFERRPTGGLRRINQILGKLGKQPLREMPAVATRAGNSNSGFVKTLMKLMTRDLRRMTLTLWGAFFLSFSTLYFLMSWIPKLVEDDGFGALAGREAFFLFNLGGVIGTFAMGVLSTRWKLSNLVCALLVSSAAAMILFAYSSGTLNSLLAIILIIGVLQQGGFVGLYSIAAKAYPTDVRSTGIGWAIGLGRSGAVAGPAVAGYLIAGGVGMNMNFVLFAVPMAIGGVIAYSLHVR